MSVGKLKLDEDQCIDLLSTLRVMNQLNQEQVWAICYQTANLMRHLSPSRCVPIENLAQVHLHRNGFIHEKTCSIDHIVNQARHLRSTSSSTTSAFSSSSCSPIPSATSTSSGPIEPSLLLSTATDRSIETEEAEPRETATTSQQHPHHHHQQHSQDSEPQLTPPVTPELTEILNRRPAINEQELVASLGLALFWALDYGIPNDEERHLSIAMEYLIFQSQNKLSLDRVIELCTNRLPTDMKSHADLHYTGICKSLVSDSIELSIFLEKIYNASMMLSDIAMDDDLSELGEPLASLRALRINDWARLWMQVIRELRQRGNFKQPVAAI